MQAAPAFTVAPAPVPISQDSWIGADDYPAPAVRAGQEGRVGYKLDVSATGMVTDCTVVTSSGSPVLDIHTCDLIRLRAHFDPARRADGVAIASSFWSGMVWRIPAGDPFDVSGASPTNSYAIDLKVGSDGLIQSCVVSQATGNYADPESLSPCDEHPPGSRFTGPTMRDGKPVAGHVRITSSETTEYDP
jgi:protein TonB